jgi:hypothetical protein
MPRLARHSIRALCAPLCLAVTACGGAGQGASPGAAPAAAAAVQGAPYAALFEPGRTWRYRVEVAIADSETAEDGMRRESHDATCKVASVRQQDTLTLSTIECDNLTAPSVPSPIAGTWAADARGLWQLDAPPAPGAAPPAPTDSAFVLDRAPRPQKRADEENGLFFTVEQRESRWCSRYEEQLAEGITRDLCFDPRGITAGYTTFAGTDTPSVELTATLQ